MAVNQEGTTSVKPIMHHSHDGLYNRLPSQITIFTSLTRKEQDFSHQTSRASILVLHPTHVYLNMMA